MTEFMKKLILISIPAMVGLTVLLCTPAVRFASRSWDAVMLGSNKTSPFYPNQAIEMQEKGDLAIHSEEYGLKKIRFATDQWGYRNESTVCSNPEIVVLGDSMAVGASLTQSDAPSSRLEASTGLCTRSFAGGKFQFALNSVYGLGMKPKWVVLIVTQRSAGQLKEFVDPVSRWSYGAGTMPWLNHLMMEWVNMRRNVYWNYRSNHGVADALGRVSGMNGSNALPVNGGSGNGQNLYFNGDWSRRVGDEEMDHDIEVLNRFSDLLKAKGARLVFAFVPNKSTIYPGNFNDADPDFGKRFLGKLNLARFDYVDLFEPFRSDWKNGVMNHHLDDTHWNSNGVGHFVAWASHLISGVSTNGGDDLGQ